MRALHDRAVNAAIIGAGHVGGALASRLVRQPGRLHLALVADHTPAAPGLRVARQFNVTTSEAGVEALLTKPEIAIAFDATSPEAHARHAILLADNGIRTIDLTAAPTGAPVVPLVNLDNEPWNGELSLLSCPAQAVVPIVRAVADATSVLYAECVSVIAARALGNAARESLDELVVATEYGLKFLGGATYSKAMIAVSPAEPAVSMRNTVHIVPADEFDRRVLAAAVAKATVAMRRLVSGYRTCSEPSYKLCHTPWGPRTSLTVTIEVTGDEAHLPIHAGSIELVAAAAQVVGEHLASGFPEQSGVAT